MCVKPLSGRIEVSLNELIVIPGQWYGCVRLKWEYKVWRNFFYNLRMNWYDLKAVQLCETFGTQCSNCSKTARGSSAVGGRIGCQSTRHTVNSSQPNFSDELIVRN